LGIFKMLAERFLRFTLELATQILPNAAAKSYEAIGLVVLKLLLPANL
jgi:hypothetical protein